MKSRWNDEDASSLEGNLLAQRVYTSRLLGADEDLVLHGGGNTSVKITEKDLFGDEQEILYVKGSGWDLGTIEEAGFAPVKLATLLRLAELDDLSDLDMVKNQRMAMTNPSAPNPSVETILHGLIPYTFVDHTHADAVVTITNTPSGEDRIKEIYGPNMLIVPYVMPGFILARTIYLMTRDVDWDSLEGMILMNHGVFTFDHDARRSYEKMINIVSQAEDYIASKNLGAPAPSAPDPATPAQIAGIRKAVSEGFGKPILIKRNTSPEAVGFSKLAYAKSLTSLGPLTPDHIIRTKRVPAFIDGPIERILGEYADAYSSYFEQYNQGETKLDQAPRWAILPGQGSLSFGPSTKHVRIIEDITAHTMQALYRSEQMEKWQALPQSDLFEVEYWSLEQAKLKRAAAPKEMQGKIALVTGAAGGIGKACVEALVKNGCVVGALDIDPAIETAFSQSEVLGIVCDVTNDQQLKDAVEATVLQFGGLDYVVANAGIFPKSAHIADMQAENWDLSMNINVTSQQRLFTFAVPYLELGFDPSIVIIGSKNVPAPGPGAAAYSVAKAGLTQLGRVAAMELGPKNIRVNIVHPNAVYDTAIWTDEVLQQRAAHYGLTVEEYKTNNMLKTEITSHHVAELAVTMLGSAFSKITGAQVPIDGGNDRVI